MISCVEDERKDKLDKLNAEISSTYKEMLKGGVLQQLENQKQRYFERVRQVAFGIFCDAERPKLQEESLPIPSVTDVSEDQRKVLLQQQSESENKQLQVLWNKLPQSECDEHMATAKARYRFLYFFFSLC